MVYFNNPATFQHVSSINTIYAPFIGHIGRIYIHLRIDIFEGRFKEFMNIVLKAALLI